MGEVLAFPPRTSAAPASPAAQDGVRALGRDLKFSALSELGNLEVNGAGKWVTVEAIAALRQSVYNWLATTPGSYRYRPSWGFGVWDYVGAKATPSRLRELEGRLRDELPALRRISEVHRVAATWDAERGVLTIDLSVRALGQLIRFTPFTFRR